ncbi:uncharacterized protein LOC115891199 [Sitophilus oryzae]|uniref:Uncharacterized protein LOC115891199 n=1 Tax=Sitophilus oryzae TaxID=7048 RepID=A0A6J2YTQ3_SITOR|nr:uncharacterized protein LOC115891199 [Sitophilus oryzae]XP_030767478.1 uncharacterized protein LOC115891199 [Sitophilus oryzae]
MLPNLKLVVVAVVMFIKFSNICQCTEMESKAVKTSGSEWNGKILIIEDDARSVNAKLKSGDMSSGAKKKHKKAEESQGLVEKHLPMLLFPFLFSSAVIPIALMTIKLLIIKAGIIGKIAVLLMILSYFRRSVNRGGVINHYMTDLAAEHYGYHGVEEPGAYINKR